MQQLRERYASRTCYYARFVMTPAPGIKLFAIAAYRLFHSHAQVLTFTDSARWTGVYIYIYDVQLLLFRLVKSNHQWLTLKVWIRIQKKNMILKWIGPVQKNVVHRERQYFERNKFGISPAISLLFFFSEIQTEETMARILERGITLFHPYSRNKSDYADLIYFLVVFETD